LLLEKKCFFIKEKVDFFKLAGEFAIFDPETNQQLGLAKEEPGALIKFLRLLIDKRLLPNKINVYENGVASPIFHIQKPFSFLRSKIAITGVAGEYLGYFQSKILTLGGGFRVFDPADRQVAEIKGDWKGWNFKFCDETGREFGAITKKWAGIGKELFTSADNYIIALDENRDLGPAQAILLLAAGLAVDIVFKENHK
jgi:uncharacterized protein YxjI